MDINNIWTTFLKRIEASVQPMAYTTWFKETKLISLKDNKAIVQVPMEIHKKHLKESYNDIIEEIFTDITGTNFQMEYYLPNELNSNVEIPNETSENVEFETNLNPNYTFETFIVGESNKFAQAMALAVAERPGFVYNPLFLYSSSGLGKTHLMHAIGNYVHNNSKKRVLYVTSEKFVNDFLELYKKNKDENNFEYVDNFKKKYRNVDVLLIDDIQYLETASKTQQEFFHTFNELHQQNKQIVIASDRSPDDFQKLEERLKTRFSWGMTINIFPPDMNLRLSIIERKLEAQQITNFPNDVKEYIASICTSDIRKLEGAISRVLAYATIMNGSDITLDLALEALRDFIGKNVISRNKIEQVQKIVATKYNLTLEDIKGKKRNANITMPRQIAMYICRNVLNEPLMKIGIEFGGKDHTTVMHSVNKIEKELKTDSKLEMEINSIVNNLK
ncbi:MAG: chromosomal replication initiator protein DnaA [Erysipelotrichaceae bacterium]|nr:chromosomal replication initiator protein DnaA [Erysipelotrichaceae bacterium]